MFLLRIKTFLKSLFFHIYSGFPKASADEISYRYSICTQCEDFDNIESICNICGCNISNKQVFLNKLAWADQECPKQKWPKIIRR
jgi:hypothetical protein